MDIRSETCLIIKRGSRFMVGKILGGPELRWSDSPWAAWRTRDREQAEKVARVIGGDLWLFNPVAGQLREVREWKA